ncbi:putative expansin-B14 [Lycium barbarum]|uniref:putative expansin-B14 n=1 Tax=Lycium barbarum TaxID=112863 RepID=UPI00293E231B|nr:putative expansin-B14 [Lycium barbarum]
MASNIPQFLFVCIFIFLFSDYISFCSCQLFNNSLDGGLAVATWYGDPNGPGSGGACGLEDDVAKAPYNAMITAGNQVLYKHGFGCGACYQVSCSKPQCSGKPITVPLTDECPGACNDDPVHFDLSGTAFGAMAKPGQADQLRKLGRIDISYKRVPCDYKQNIMFKVDKGSNPYFFATAIEAENGDGALSSVEIKTAGSNKWLPMKQMFGATWSANINPKTQKPPYSLRLTSEFKRRVKADNVIPVGWQPRAIYKSNVNFPPKL